jgi:hypothetical protein
LDRLSTSRIPYDKAITRKARRHLFKAALNDVKRDFELDSSIIVASATKPIAQTMEKSRYKIFPISHNYPEKY